MIKRYYFTHFKTKLFCVITALCLAATPSSALPRKENSTIDERYEYAYQEIYASLIPDEHPYPDNFPYRIGLLYSTPIDMENNIFEQDLHITGIRFYDGDTLIQELATQAQGLYIPEFTDFNFDGFLDIAIPLASSNSKAFPYQYWLYNPHMQRFEDAPSSLQAISAPAVDDLHQHIYAYRFDTNRLQSIDVYQWKGKGEQLQLKESLTSYSLPLTLGGETLYCDNAPYYDSITGQATYPFRISSSEQNKVLFNFYDWNEKLGSYTRLEYSQFLKLTHQLCSPRSLEAQMSDQRLQQTAQARTIPVIDAHNSL